MSFILISAALSVIALLLSVWLGRINPARSSSLTAGMFLLILASPLLLLLPKLTVTLPWLNEASTSTSAITAPQSTSLLPAMVWGCVAAFLIGRILLNRFAIAHWIKNSRPAETPVIKELQHECSQILNIKQDTRIRFSQHVQSPVVTGMLRPTILLPENAKEWSHDTMRMVLLHELGHVSRRDLWLSMAAHLTCALHWFNPLVWLLKKRLSSECEFACDAHIISRGADVKTYSLALCDVAKAITSHQSNSAVLAMAGHAPLRKRVDLLLSGKRSSNPVLVTTILTLTAGTTLALTLVRAEAPRSLEIPKAIPVADDPYSPEEVQMRLTADPFPAD